MKTEFLKFFFATLISLTSIIPALATNDLTLTGSVTGVTAEYKDKFEGKDRYFFRMTVMLQFKNESNGSVIILRPDSFNGKKRLTFTNDYSNSSSSQIEAIPLNLRYPLNVHLNSRGLPVQEPDLVASFLDELKGKEPRDYIFAIIPPDGYYECRDSFLVENGFKTREEPNKNPKLAPRIIAIPEFSGFKIEYQLSIGDRPQGMEFLQDAKQKWSKYGKLIFDQDGKYSVKSDLILNMPSN